MDLFVERVLDGDGNLRYYDIAFASGKLKVVDGKDEIANRILVNLNTYRGENYRDVTHGVDYFNNVYGYEVTDIIVQDEMKAAILGTRGVTQLTSFSLTRLDGSRTATLTAHAITTDGELDITTDITV